MFRPVCKMLVLVLLGIQLVSCAPTEQPEVHGFLYFGAGDYLAKLDLRDGSTSVVLAVIDAEINHLSLRDDDRLLMSVFGPVNHKDTHRLILVDRPTKQLMTMFEGRYGEYLPGGKALVYDDGNTIKVTLRVRGTWRRMDIASHRINGRVRILPVSATRFLFSVDGGSPNLFDFDSDRLTELSHLGAVCGLDGALWSAPREQLLCEVRGAGDDSSHHAFVGLDGTIHEALQLPAAKRFRPVAFLPDQNALVLTEQWHNWFSDRPKWAIWIYRFDDNLAYRLVDDQYVGNSVLYGSQ